jgi:hypothetical protein
MKNPVKIVIILIVILGIGILIYRSPDEAYWLKENPQNAIEIGRAYAYYLLNSYKQGLLKMSVDPAKAKIENSNFRQIAMMDMYDQLEKKKMPVDITAPLITEQKDEDMELIALEKFESFIVMTFAYKSWDKIVQIPDKGKMLFSVAVRYHNPIDNRLVTKLVRKIANLPLLRNLTGRIGTTGRWVVFDYNYKYNLNDYFDWVLKEGENYDREQLKESEEFMRYLENKESFEKFSKKELEEFIARGLDFLYEWGSMAVEKQIDRIERFYKAQQEIEKNDKLEKE